MAVASLFSSTLHPFVEADSRLRPLFLVFIILLSIYAITAVSAAYKPGLRSIPGPFFARFSTLYRVWMVWDSKADVHYRDLHRRYGPIVRVGPNAVSVSDPTMIPVIYGIGSKFLKSKFYAMSKMFYQGESFDSLFSTRDPVYHANLKRPVAQLYSMTNMRNYERFVDECNAIFVDAMREMRGQVFDLGVWLQYYAFDVIAYITFQRRFGFMDQGRDVNNMIGDLDKVQDYQKIIGQLPQLHPYLFGNRTLLKFAKALFPNLPDPLFSFLKITEEEIVRYDKEETTAQEARTDFLAQIREKETTSSKVSFNDMINHLSVNIIAGSDTTAISLRSIFYYLMKDARTYTKLVDEIDQANEQGRLSHFITYEECLRLPYLQAVIKEALRIHPAVGLALERVVPPEGATICDVNLPANTNVFMMAPVIHMNKNVYGEDALQFRPERWIEASPDQLKLMDRSFLAFGHGARTCIGRNISTLEMGKFVPQILRTLNVEWAGEGKNSEWTTRCNFLFKQTDMPVRFTVRKEKI